MKKEIHVMKQDKLINWYQMFKVEFYKEQKVATQRK